MKKRILILSDADFVGGSEINYKILVPEFYKRGWQVFWMTSDATGSVQRILSHEVFTFYPVLYTYLSLSDPVSKRFSVSNTLKNVQRVFHNIKLINRFVQENGIEVVLSISMMSHFSQIFIKAPKKIAHIQDHIRRNKAYGLYGKGLDIITQKVDTVVLCSSFLRDNYRNRFRNKLEVIYNPLEEVATDKKPHKNRIGMFARYVAWKGHQDFIKIAQEVLSLDNTIEFVAYGNISDTNRKYYDSLNQEINRLGLDKHVSLNGFTSDIQGEMAQCSAILHLSKSPEPFGRIIVEAAQLGVPVIGYHGGGGTEIFQKFSIPGMLVEPGDIMGIVKLIMSREQYRGSKSDLSSLSQKKIANDFIQLFEN